MPRSNNRKTALGEGGAMSDKQRQKKIHKNKIRRQSRRHNRRKG
jgi:hypothetical protein